MPVAHLPSMMRWSVLLLLLLVPTGMAAINEPLPFEADYPFSDPQEDEFINVLSGRLDAELGRTNGPFGFFDVQGFSIRGLDQVCWYRAGQTPSTRDCISGDVRMDVKDGSNVGLQLATRTTATYEAEHALAVFLKQRGDDLNTLNLNQSILVPAVDGRMQFGDIPEVPGIAKAFFGGGLPSILAPTSAATEVTIVGDRIETVSGREYVFAFEGKPAIAPFGSNFVVLPFDDDSLAEFGVADPDAAREGLDVARVETMFQLLSGASADPTAGGGENLGESPLADSISEVLNSALIRIPTDPSIGADEIKDQVAIVLFQAMDVSNAGGELTWEGDAAFQYQGGEIAGAKELHGVWYFQLPWWGWLIWVVAVGLFIARLAMKPDKHHPTWDRYKWIGWASGFLMFALIFFLWDLEMRSVWGTSILSTGTSGTAFWVTFGIQLATMFLVLGVLGWPLGILIKNALLLSKQGTFMGLGKPVSLLLAFLLGATLFLSYLELIIGEAVAQI